MAKHSSDRIFCTIAIAGLLPPLAVGFALSRATHDLQLIIASAPTPIPGLCQQAVTYTLSPLAYVSYVAFGGFAVGSCLIGLAAFAVVLTSTKRRLKRLLSASCSMPKPLESVFRRCGLSEGTLIESHKIRAVTYGYFRPRVAVTTGLVEALDPDELRAVLLHEAAHVRRRDPLRMLVVSVLSRAFFFAPVVRELAHQFQAAKEIDADSYVVATMRTRKYLASALLRVAEMPQAGALAGFEHLIDARIASLEGEEPFLPSRHRMVGRGLSIAVLAAVTLGLFFITTGAVDSHVLHVCS